MRSKPRNRLRTVFGVRAADPLWLEGAVRIHYSYLRNAAFMFEPWINVWQSVQGVSSDEPAFIP